jgi:hypothetical protein
VLAEFEGRSGIWTTYLREVNAFDIKVGYNLVNALGFP